MDKPRQDMTELEKSIEYFERAHETMARHGHTAPLEEINALAALYEKKKRQSGCVWCKENGMVTHNGQHYELFCSYCGRRLEVEGEGKVNE